MIGSFGSSEFGSTEFLQGVIPSIRRLIALLGDSSNHGGSIVSTNQDGSVKAEGKVIPVEGAIFQCPIESHGNTEIHGNLDDDWFINGKKVVLEGSIAGCGAVIISSAMKTYGS